MSGTSGPGSAFLFLLLVQWVTVGHAFRVLYILPYCGSHVLFHNQLAQSIVSHGHQITVVRPLEKNMYDFAKSPNITEFLIGVNNSDGKLPYLTHEENGRGETPLKLFWDNGLSITAVPWDGLATGKAVCAALLSHEPLKEDLRQHHFDVAVVELMYNECGLALAQAHGIPVVGFWPLFFAGGQPQYTSAFNAPSVVPTLLSGVPDSMTFAQRLLNFALYLAGKVIMQIYFHTISSTIVHFLPESPPPAALLANLSGVLIGSHYALDYPRPLPPTFINVGDMHLREPKPLPQDLEDFMQSSGDSGVIFFSMGAVFDPEIMPKQILQSFLRAFARVPQKVLMKMKSNYTEVPANVKVSTWLPQQDILGHPKTVLFVTHCGLKGTLEALYHAVPIVGMPIFLDQGDILTRLLDKGVGVGITKGDSEDTIHQAIVQVVNNTSYKKRMRSLSSLLRESPEAPAAERAVRLLEYVAVTKGADHLKVASRNLDFVQYFCIDVICVLLGVGAVMLYGVVWLTSKFYEIAFRKKSKMD
ncbi:UDP-glucuronosyltransferase 2B15-like [Oratosquilla oratoria]|uniref:UDP-glucuronosyltransferase 2B15-like n=1 Tax=Oratosquilla oratoria TaxID=337810 RepID=UPI003F763513